MNKKAVSMIVLLLILLLTVGSQSKLTSKPMADASGMDNHASENTAVETAENNDSGVSEDKAASKEAVDSTDETTNRTIIIYFSCTGNTARIAKMIEDETGAAVYRIEAEVPYTAADLNYNDSSSRATREQNDPTARPAFKGGLDGLAQYDTIYLGYPFWWGQAPKIMYTFLESYDFSGKTIVPFCTSHSSAIGSSDTNLHACCDDTVVWLPGRRFSAQSTREDVKTWLESLELPTASKALPGVFDFETKTVMLNSGYQMPVIGLGTYSLLDDVCVASVSESLKAGGRLIDTAYMYHNEESVGKGILESGVPREDVFITTKLYMNQYAQAAEAIDEALQKLGVTYIDLMLLHHPGEHDVAAYKAMETAVAEGKIRSIGLSNYYVEELEAFLPQVTITPAVVQNEIHPYYQENDVIPYIQEKGIVMEGWYPLGGRGYTAELLNNEVLNDIAEAHGKTAAQVILRWNLQRQVIAIPGSSNPEHIRENLALFDFVLTDEEMLSIKALDRNEKHDWY